MLLSCLPLPPPGPNGALPKALAELLRPAAVAAYQEALAAVFTSTAEARRKVKDAAVRALEEAFALLQLYGHGCELCEVRGSAVCTESLCLAQGRVCAPGSCLCAVAVLQLLRQTST